MGAFNPFTFKVNECSYDHFLNCFGLVFVGPFLLYIYIFGCVGSSLLHVGFFFSSCGERGLLFIAVHGLLIVVASLVVEHGL